MLLRQQLPQIPVVTRMDTPTNDNVLATPVQTNYVNSHRTTDYERFRNVPDKGYNKVITAGIVYNVGVSPSSDGSFHNERGCIHQLGMSASGGDSGNGGGGGDGELGNSSTIMINGGVDKSTKEFMLVNPRNVIVPSFSGFTLNSKPYMPFNKAMRKLIRAQGIDGELMLEVLIEVEKYCNTPFDNDKFHDLILQCPKAAQFNAAVQAALENYTTDVAEGMVRYGVLNGIDAWRRLYNHYVFLAEELQDILIQELYELRPVDEGSIDKLFDEIHRISEWYVKAGTENIS